MIKLIDLDGDLFPMKERVLWTGNALLMWPFIWLTAVNKIIFIYKYIIIIIIIPSIIVYNYTRYSYA